MALMTRIKLSYTYIFSRFCTALLSPILVTQGKRLMKSIPRLPGATDNPAGIVGSDPGNQPQQSLVVLGESTVAGVGTDNYQTSLTAFLAKKLSDQMSQIIGWQAHGKNGLTAKGLIDKFLPRLEGQTPDFIVIVLGVNDTKGFTSLKSWRQCIQHIIDNIKAHHPQSALILCGVPNVGDFPALPQPMRFVMALQARCLDLSLQLLCNENQVIYCETPSPDDRECYANDGFHPSKKGYQLWAGHLADAISESSPIRDHQGHNR